MIDISKYDGKKEFCKLDLFVIKDLEDHGFSGKLLNMNTSGLKFALEKNGIKDELHITATRLWKYPKETLDVFYKNFALLEENVKLRELLGK